MAIKFPFRTKSTTQTTGQGTYTLDEPVSVAGYRNFSMASADGDLPTGSQVPYIVVDTTLSRGDETPAKLLEVGLGTWNNAANTLTRDTVYQPAGGAVDWGTGTRDVYVVDDPLLFMVAANALQEIEDAGQQSAARTNLGLGTAATVNTGTGTGTIPVLTASGLPAVGGSGLTSLPAILPGPTGTKMPFYQDAAPSGWTIQTGSDYTDAMLYVTKGSGGSDRTGGTKYNVGAWDNAWGLSCAGHALTTSEVPGLQSTNLYALDGSATGVYGYISSANAHSHSVTGSSQWRPPGLYCVICAKNAP